MYTAHSNDPIRIRLIFKENDLAYSMLCIRCIVRSVNLTSKTFNNTSNYIRRIVIRCRPFRCNVAPPNNTSNKIRGNVFSVISVHDV